MNNEHDIFFVDRTETLADLAKFNTKSEKSQRLTDTGDVNFPVMSPDGTKVAFQKAIWAGWELGELHIRNIEELLKPQALP